MSLFVYEIWPVWKWALYFMVRSGDQRIFQKKQIIFFSSEIVPILRLEKALGLSSLKRIPKTSLTKRENEVMFLYFFGHFSGKSSGKSARDK